MSIGELVGKYIAVRDKMNALKKDHKAQIAPYTKALETLENEFKKSMDSSGVENLKTSEGVAFLASQSSVTASDKISFLAYVQENDAWHLLDIRPSKTAVQEFVQEFNAPPPGVNYTRRQVVNVRKS